jgi:hypothetical protein
MVTEAEEFENGNMKLAVVSSITGSVKTFPSLGEMCVKALDSIEQTETTNYYKWGLLNGDFVPASSNGAYVYDPNNAVAVAHVKAMLKAEESEVLHPYFMR